jgi:hypothetical protein
MHFAREVTSNWIFEHVTLAMFAIAHALFFTVDSPDARKAPTKNLMAGIRITVGT